MQMEYRIGIQTKSAVAPKKKGRRLFSIGRNFFTHPAVIMQGPIKLQDHGTPGAL
jgi:hypothetical protein